MAELSHYAAIRSNLDRSVYPRVPAGLAAAHAALGVAPAALAAVDQAAPWRPVLLLEENRREAADGPVAFAHALAEQLLDGQPMPADFAKQAWAAELSNLQAAAADRVARLLQGHVEAAFTDAAEQGKDELLVGLREQLAELVEQARAAAAVLTGHDVADPASLVTAAGPVRQAFRAVDELAVRYAGLRAAHLSTVLAGEDMPRNRGVWRELEAGGWTELLDAATTAVADWPTDPRARLLELVRHEPWLPALDEASHARTRTLSGAA